jgi:predicted AAA+ superfamily ATPase
VNIGRDLISKSSTNQEAKSRESNLEQIERLYGLKEKGIITEDEFQAKKKQLLEL